MSDELDGGAVTATTAGSEAAGPTTDASGAGLRIDDLALMPAATILDEAALADLLRVTTRTIRKMVSRYELPPGILFGGRKRWFAGKVLAHLDAAADRAARAAEKEAARFRAISS